MKNYLKSLLPVTVAILALLSSCTKKAADDRPYEAAKIVAVKIDGVTYNTTNSDAGALAVLPAGTNLEKVKLDILAINGDLVGFENGTELDCRYPLDVKIAAYDGTSIDTKVIIQSPPAMTSFIIEGVTLDSKKIFSSADMVVAQVPENTDLTALKVTMEFINGTVQDFVNGTVKDYTSPVKFTILGVDGTTVYPYDLILTTQEVGPATINGMKVNGIATDSVIVDSKNVVTAYVHGLTDFSKATITDIELGYGNKANAGNVYTDLNLHTGTNKIKVTGSNGIETEFTFGTAQVSVPAMYTLPYADIKIGGNGAPVAVNNIRGAAITGNYVVLSAQNAAQGAGLYYDFVNGTYGGTMNMGTGLNWGLHRVASDEDGVMLFTELGLTANKQTIYRWNDVTAAREAYIEFTGAGIGSVLPSYRNAGIAIQGRLAGDALITITTAQKNEVFVWEVIGGVLNQTPKRYEASAISGLGYYWTVCPMPIGTDGFVAAYITNAGTGIMSLTSTMGQGITVSGMTTSAVQVVKHNNRTYIAYVVFAAGKGAYMRVCDITAGDQKSFSNPIFNQLFTPPVAAGNSCMSSDFTLIDGKLHAMFMCENFGVKVFNLEP